jgi:hypothetical protein
MSFVLFAVGMCIFMSFDLASILHFFFVTGKVANLEPMLLVQPAKVVE